MRIVIVGGVAGGMSAATRLRRLLEDAEITVYERSGHVSFANCGLPYHVGGVIEERSALLLQTPQSLGARFGLDVRVGHEVVGVDRDRHVLRVRDLASGREEERGYDVLVLSPGAVPVRPPVPGIERALVLRDIEDTDAVVAAVEGARSAVVVGGGYVGLEVAEQLVHRGLQVSLVEAAPQVMAPLDPEMVEPVHTLMRERGLDLRLGTTVTEVGERTVTLDDGTELPADVVLAAARASVLSGRAAASSSTSTSAPPTRTSTPWGTPWRSATPSTGPPRSSRWPTRPISRAGSSPT